MKVLVFYYSFSGNSKLVADTIGRKLDAEMRPLEEAKKRSKIGAYIMGARAAMKGIGSQLKQVNMNTEGADLIIIGTPIWASSPVPAVYSFLAQADLKDKNVAVYTTMAGDSGDKAIDKIREIVESKGGKLIDSIAIRTHKISSESLIKTAEEFANKHK